MVFDNYHETKKGEALSDSTSCIYFSRCAIKTYTSDVLWTCNEKLLPLQTLFDILIQSHRNKVQDSCSCYKLRCKKLNNLN